MIEFFIKSNIAISILFASYFFLLKDTKAFVFNRFYLLFSMLFSVCIPFISISLDSVSVLNYDIQNITNTTEAFVFKVGAEANVATSFFTVKNILLGLYICVFLVLLIRLLTNLIKLSVAIIRLPRNNDNLVLTEHETLPYSFFKTIVVNRKDYEMGNINDELILHEKVHVTQKHSLDILMAELLKILLWFNPVVWLLGKEIHLNHEYLADEAVLANRDAKTYQQILLNLVFRNNSTYLASNFNYSFTKKRLIMMTKNNSLKKEMVQKIAIIPLVLLLTIALSYSQGKSSKKHVVNIENEWWYPLLQKHSLELGAYNNFSGVLEMGASNSIDNNIVSLTDATFIIKRSDETYCILTTTGATHDLKSNVIKGGVGWLLTYSFDPDKLKPVDKKIHCQGFEIDLDKNNWIVDIETGYVLSSD